MVRALERERRRQIAAKDAAILAAQALDNDEINGLAAYAVDLPSD